MRLLLTILLLTISIAVLAQDYEPVRLFRYSSDRTPVGTSAYPVGDQNGDGYDDFLVERSGHIVMFFGGDPIDSIPDIIYPDSYVRPFGDINGDGIIDLLTTWGDWNGMGIIWGGSLEDSAQVALPVLGVEGAVWNSFYSAGDVNGDGYDDFVRYYERYPDQWYMYGKTDLFLGGEQIDTNAVLTLIGDSLRGRLWFDDYGDVDGNGQVDLLITYYLADVNRINHHILLPNILQEDTLREIDYTETFADDVGIGFAQILKDLNGDGCDEILIPNANPDRIGGTSIFLGGEDLDTDLDWDLRLPRYYAAGNISIVGDVNNDGYNDLGFSIENTFSSTWRAHVYLGGEHFDNEVDAVIVSPFEGEDYNHGLGSYIIAAGDPNGNGVDDMIVLSDANPINFKFALIVSLDEEFAAAPPVDPFDPSPPSIFILDTPYPNPFNDGLVIPFRLFKRSEIEVNVIDISGRRSLNVFTGFKPAGNHTLTYRFSDTDSTSESANGLYIIQLRSEGSVQYEKAVLLK